MHDVHQHFKTKTVRLVHQVLQILGRPAPKRGGEKVGHLVPETRVVRVVSHRHQLHRAVPQIGDAPQVRVREVAVRAVPVRLARHPDVRLVYAQRRRAAIVVVGEIVVANLSVTPDVLLRLGRIVVHAVVVVGALVLAGRDRADPRGYAVEGASLRCLHRHADSAAVSQPGFGGNAHRPLPELVLLALKLPRRPVVEVAHQRQTRRAGRVLDVSHVAFVRIRRRVGVYAVLPVTLRERAKRDLVSNNLVAPRRVQVVPSLERALVRREAGVVAAQRESTEDGARAPSRPTRNKGFRRFRKSILRGGVRRGGGGVRGGVRELIRRDRLRACRRLRFRRDGEGLERGLESVRDLGEVRGRRRRGRPRHGRGLEEQLGARRRRRRGPVFRKASAARGYRRRRFGAILRARDDARAARRGGREARGDDARGDDARRRRAERPSERHGTGVLAGHARGVRARMQLSVACPRVAEDSRNLSVTCQPDLRLEAVVLCIFSRPPSHSTSSEISRPKARADNPSPSRQFPLGGAFSLP